MYKGKNGIIYTDVYMIKGQPCCRVGRIHPSFKSYGSPFTFKGQIFMKVKEKKGLLA